MAPTLEARAAALAQAVGRANRTTAVILAPDNAYGKRAVAAFEKSLPKMGVKSLKSIYYPPNTTSFSKVLEPVRSSLKSAAVLIPDQLGRVELVVRQMVRDGVVIDRPKQPGVPVLSTAEGCSPEAIGAGHEVLEGVLVAPVGWETPRRPASPRRTRRWKARARRTRRGWSTARWPRRGPASRQRPSAAAVLRVESGRFVATESAVSLTPAERPRAADASSSGRHGSPAPATRAGARAARLSLLETGLGRPRAAPSRGRRRSSRQAGPARRRCTPAGRWPRTAGWRGSGRGPASAPGRTRRLPRPRRAGGGRTAAGRSGAGATDPRPAGARARAAASRPARRGDRCLYTGRDRRGDLARAGARGGGDRPAAARLGPRGTT
ncbi:ABC transporter substrate-binding protein [Nannocystis pusilla]|uniref:ABC transporter substrate-binding protein n=1 Tax=Nannocystis pusilla TaxID=889268 RepID=UPI003B7E558B